MTDPLGSFYAE